MTTQTVANTILEQLGGNQFLAMTGARNLLVGDRHLSFRVTHAKNKANYVHIKLNGSDLYDVEFLNYRTNAIRTVSVHNNIYADQLRGVFERETGLLTML